MATATTAHPHLGTYLNDHLAGAMMALELLERLKTMDAAAGLEDFLAALKADIEDDREELRGLVERLGLSQSSFRQAVGWLGDKVAELKLRVDDPSGGALRLFESLEVLSLGIEGKRALWRVLAAVADRTPALRGLDYERLEQRAVEQRSLVERRRLEAAQRAFAES